MDPPLWREARFDEPDARRQERTPDFQPFRQFERTGHRTVRNRAPTTPFRPRQQASRRPERHQVFGNNAAILTGDLLFARASQLMADLGERAIRLQAGAVVADVRLAGCSVSGVAFPDVVKQQRYMPDLADYQSELLSGYIEQTNYLHVVFGDEDTHVNNAVILFGDPTSAFGRDKGSSNGEFNLDIAVVSIGSVDGLEAFGNEVYGAAKAGLSNLIQNLGARYGPGTVATTRPRRPHGIPEV
ncbi:hypothetical protein QBC33DRAFT_564341 [Phialemonium atrogriseum]|uniref:Uncharacterized protein n=1 Tax=Phialemonium atrogriseum TaxID=1093897 RepID=A0AAJ0BP50_9PEZI|nr:uncharacterized protein QBC33DRAFT_564341 [Phialemonium atrogriseum]KAK1761889.1 hypothetical protein QBC33DRAFT_564341 [Phialemonium atrogriseum]